MKKISESKEKHYPLYNYIENLKFSTRLAVVNAIRKRSDQKRLKKDQENPYVRTNKIAKDMRKFNQDFEDNMKEYREIRSENDTFSEKYRLAKEKNPSKKDYNSKSSFQKTFTDLISIYKKKGYKMPDISLKNNLFERSPILMENDKIVRNYPIGDNTKSYSKDLNYASRLNNIVNQRIVKEERRFSFWEYDTAYSKVETADDENKEKSFREFIKEVGKNEDQFAKSKSLVETGDYKHLYELKNREQNSFKIENKKSDVSQTNLFERKALSTKATLMKNTGGKIATKKLKNIKQSINYNIKKKSIKSNSNDKYMEPIIIKNFVNPSETARMRDLNKSKTMKNFNFNPAMKIQARSTSLIEIEPQELLKEKEEMKNSIENAIASKLKEGEDLNSVYERVVGKEEVKNIILDYYVKKGKDRKLLEEKCNKKIEPHDLMRYFSETKNRINKTNICELHQNFMSRFGALDINTKDLYKVKELDNQLSRLDYRLVRDLNKLHKY